VTASASAVSGGGFLTVFLLLEVCRGNIWKTDFKSSIEKIMKAFKLDNIISLHYY